MKLRTPMLVLALTLAAAGAGHAAQNLESLQAEIVGLYAEMHASLAEDSAVTVMAKGGELGAKAASAAGLASDPAPYRALSEAAASVAAELDIEKLREAFKGLSVALAALVESGQLSGVELYYCAMADGYWAQREADGGARNPYYGKSMLRCGERVDKVRG